MFRKDVEMVFLNVARFVGNPVLTIVRMASIARNVCVFVPAEIHHPPVVIAVLLANTGSKQRINVSTITFAGMVW